jgi:hypothetical protein
MCRIPTKGNPRHGSVGFAKMRRACASSMDSGKKRLIDLYSKLRGFERGVDLSAVAGRREVFSPLA